MRRVGEIVIEGSITCEHASCSQNDNLLTNIDDETLKILVKEVAKANIAFEVLQARVQLTEALSKEKADVHQSEQVTNDVENQTDASADARLEDDRLKEARLEEVDQTEAESDQLVQYAEALSMEKADVNQSEVTDDVENQIEDARLEEVDQTEAEFEQQDLEVTDADSTINVYSLQYIYQVNPSLQMLVLLQLPKPFSN